VLGEGDRRLPLGFCRGIVICRGNVVRLFGYLSSIELQGAVPYLLQLPTIQRRTTLFRFFQELPASLFGISPPFEDLSGSAGESAVPATFRYGAFHFGKGIFCSLLIKKLVNGGVTSEDIYLCIRVSKEEPSGIQGIIIEEGICCLDPLHQRCEDIGVSNRINRECHMETGSGRTTCFLLHMVAAGVYDARHIRKQPGNIRGGYPRTGIV